MYDITEEVPGQWPALRKALGTAMGYPSSTTAQDIFSIKGL
jgi:hypothetical protein